MRQSRELNQKAWRCAIQPFAWLARIHVFIATSAIHMEKKLRMTPEQVKQAAAEGVAHARGYVRTYATAVGLNADDVTLAMCRLDRRARFINRELANLVNPQ